MTAEAMVFADARGWCLRPAAELLEPAEAAFDEMSLGIEMLVDGILAIPRRVVGNDGRARLWAIVRRKWSASYGIGDDGLSGHALDERSCLGHGEQR
jgi:hypothetical protein